MSRGFSLMLCGRQFRNNGATRKLGPIDRSIEAKSAKARIERRAGDFLCSGRVTGYPEVTPKTRCNVRVGHNPTEMYARRINMLRSPLFRSFSMCSRSRWTQTFLSRGAR